MLKETDQSGDFWYGYHAFYDAGITPGQFSDMSPRERAIIIAYIDIRLDAEEKARKKAKKGV